MNDAACFVLDSDVHGRDRACNVIDCAADDEPNLALVWTLILARSIKTQPELIDFLPEKVTQTKRDRRSLLHAQEADSRALRCLSSRDRVEDFHRDSAALFDWNVQIVNHIRV